MLQAEHRRQLAPGLAEAATSACVISGKLTRGKQMLFLMLAFGSGFTCAVTSGNRT